MLTREAGAEEQIDQTELLTRAASQEVMILEFGVGRECGYLGNLIQWGRGNVGMASL
jgi:hypothetical protein